VVTWLQVLKEAKVKVEENTITDHDTLLLIPIGGFEDVKPMVFAGIYPVDTEDYSYAQYGETNLMTLHLSFKRKVVRLGFSVSVGS
jgi:translation elongation factor EF-4